MSNLSQKAELPSPWVEQWSEQHQTPYYINISSGESTWIAPQLAPPAYDHSEPAGPPPAFKATNGSSNSFTNAQRLPSPSSSRSSSHSPTLGSQRPSPPLASTSSSSFGNAISRLTNHTPNQRWHSSQSPPLPTSQGGLGSRFGGLINRASGGSPSQEQQTSRTEYRNGIRAQDMYGRGEKTGYLSGLAEKEESFGTRYGSTSAEERDQGRYLSTNDDPSSSRYPPPPSDPRQQSLNNSSSSQTTLGGLGEMLQSTGIGGRFQQRGERLMAIPSRIEGRAMGVERSDKGQRKWEKMERKEERRDRKEERKDRKAERRAVKRGYV
ncbi:hypothetical protein BCR35DRAFT_153925 [Leucosporidium creatinivorum]|uniref:WW domain-containing protein n=1 Tax=Leucosporidium creatinivorum TaxID=106004 RepID=A0A1Y2EMZ7_9BASI|nr:hypothetical protein BCR35DRAFT_153925 [Leucosporidium creatinivorum]